MNIVVLNGRLTRDVELRYTSSNKPVANGSLAVSRGFKNEDGEYDTDFINFQVWGKQAENLQKYCKKGSMIAVCGELRVDVYQDKEGNNKRKEYVFANKVEFLDTKKDDKKETNQNVNNDPYQEMHDMLEDDMPF